MLKTYIKTAIRSLSKNKFFSLINVLGLAMGISAALVIYLIVAYDFSFDKFEKDKERIYRVVANYSYSGNNDYSSGMCYPLANALKKEVTGVDIVAPFSMWSENTKITIPGDAGTKQAVYKNQERIIFADENYFNLLGYQWLSGSPRTSLAQPYQVVLTASNAKKLFPALPVWQITGKKIIFDDSIQTIVTGIVKDITEKTDFTFTTFVSRATQEHTSLRPEYWDAWNYSLSTSKLMVKLSAGSSAAQIERQINALDKKYNKPDPDEKIKTNYALQPLNDIHFNDSYGTFEQRVAHKPTLYGLLAVAGFILLLGCINFINLTTAQASQRSKETGIRKTMGSSRRQLIFQFLGETFLLTFIATLLSTLIAPLLLKVFAEFIPQGLHYRLQPDVLIFLLLLLTIVSLLSGFYPALILSAYKPVAILKNHSGTFVGKTRNASLRKTLNVSQFVIAQVFIIATLLVSKQIHYSLNKDMGFKKEAILYFRSSHYDTSVSKRIHLKEKLKSIPEIKMVSLSNDPPSIDNEWLSILTYRDGKKEIEKQVQIKLADTSYIKLYGMKLLAGANLPWSDTVKNLLINETYAKSLGFINPQHAIGKYIEWNDKNLLITGVVADFHPRSIHEPIKPLIITSRIRGEFVFNIALLPQNAAGTHWKTAIGKIEKAWKEIYPENDFKYQFIDDTIARYYTAEQNLSRLLRWATGLTIFVSCLGLLGLVTYITHQRTKEIGVRKVIGASVTQIVLLLSKDFIKLVLIAFLIAVPVSWLGAYQWLQNFAYRTTIGVWIFLAGGLILLSMALLVLGIQTYKAAIANPVASLRSE